MSNLNFRRLGTTALLAACYKAKELNTYEIVVNMVSQGADPSFEDDKGMSPLKYAVLTNDMKLLKILTKS